MFSYSTGYYPFLSLSHLSVYNTLIHPPHFTSLPSYYSLVSSFANIPPSPAHLPSHPSSFSTLMTLQCHPSPLSFSFLSHQSCTLHSMALPCHPSLPWLIHLSLSLSHNPYSFISYVLHPLLFLSFLIHLIVPYLLLLSIFPHFSFLTCLLPPLQYNSLLFPQLQRGRLHCKRAFKKVARKFGFRAVSERSVLRAI
jgi:hypothetical protein